MLEAIFLITLCGLGIIFSYPLKRDVPLSLLLALSPLTGGLCWMFIVIIFGLLKLPINGPIILASCIVAAAFYFLLMRGYKNWDIKLSDVAKASLYFILVFIAVQLLQSIDDLIYHTGDSFIMIDMGRYWLDSTLELDINDLLSIREKTLTGAQHLPHFLNAYGFYIPSIQAASVFAGHSVLSYFPIASLSFLWAIELLLNKILKQRTDFSQKLRWFFLALFILLIASNSAYIQHSRYLHSNLSAGLFLAVSVLTFYLYLLENKPSWLVLSAWMLLGLSFSRTETPIWSLSLIALYLLNANIPTRLRRTVLLPLLLTISFWHLYIYFDVQTLGSATALILSPALLITIIFIFSAAALVIYFFDTIPNTFFPLLNIAFLGSLTTLAIFFLTTPNGILLLQGVLINMVFLRGMWGLHWILILAILLVIPTKTNETADRILKYSVIIGFLLILIAGGIRSFYRPGWTDSGNRMLMHVFPIFTIYLGLKVSLFFDWLQKEKSREQAIS